MVLSDVYVGSEIARSTNPSNLLGLPAATSVRNQPCGGLGVHHNLPEASALDEDEALPRRHTESQR